MRYFLFLSLPLYVLDQWTKWLIVSNFPDPSLRETIPREITVIAGFFDIVRVHNTGMAFGLLNGSAYANYFFGAIALIALAAITLLWKKQAFPTRVSKTAAALLISGILGNLTDRLLPGRGYVVDFLDFNFGSYIWPSFNVADSCICVAAGLLILSAFQDPDKPAAGDSTSRRPPNPEEG